jgi:hypothetical protein
MKKGRRKTPLFYCLNRRSINAIIWVAAPSVFAPASFHR